MKRSKFLEKTSNACLENARQYIEDAEILCSFRSYGHALAFTTLSNIEMGKAGIYYLFSKNLIPETTLPKPYSTYYINDEVGKFAAEAWWIGYVIISNIEDVLQNIIEVTEEITTDTTEEFGIKLTEKGQKIQKNLILIMMKENEKIKEIDKQITKAFLVQTNFKKNSIITPSQVKKADVKELIKIAKKKLQTVEPFRDFPLNSIQQNLTKMLLTIAFLSIIPLKKEIAHCLIPSTSNFLYEQ